MIARGRHAVPRGAPCGYCGKPIRTAVRPRGHTRKYCDRVRCRRERQARVSRAAYYRDHAQSMAYQRATYDPAKRRARYLALTSHQRAGWRAAQRRYRKAHRAEQNAHQRATYDPAARHAHYLATGT